MPPTPTSPDTIEEVPDHVPSRGNRVRSLLLDYLVILGWIAILTVVGFLARMLFTFGETPATVSAGQLVLVDLAVLTATVLPVWIYLCVTEAGPAQATWGKARAGLEVVRLDGARPSVGRILGRNAVKLLPWQLAHISVARAILEIDQPIVMATTYAASIILVVVTVVMAWRDPWQRPLHDLVAGTRVVVTG